MKVVCKKCNTAYELDSNKFTDKTLNVRCTTCGEVFAITSDKEEVSKTEEKDVDKIEQTDVSQSENKLTKWKVKISNGLVYGFEDDKSVKDWIRGKKIDENDLISFKGGPWKKLVEEESFKKDLSSREDNLSEDSSVGAEYKTVNLDNDVLSADDIKDDSKNKKEPVFDLREGKGEDEYKGVTNITMKRKEPVMPSPPSFIVREDSSLTSKHSFKDNKMNRRKFKRRSKTKWHITIPILIIFVALAFMFTQPKGKKYMRAIYSKVQNVLGKRKSSSTDAKKKRIPIYKRDINYKNAKAYLEYGTLKSLLLADSQFRGLYSKFNSPEVLAERAFSLAMLGYKTKDNKHLIKALEFSAFSLTHKKSELDTNLMTLAIYHMAKGTKRPDLAMTEDYLKRTLKINAKNKWVHYIGGLHFLRLGQISKAKESMLRALELDSSFIAVHRELLKIAKGERDERKIEFHENKIMSIEKKLFYKYPNLRSANDVKKKIILSQRED